MYQSQAKTIPDGIKKKKEGTEEKKKRNIPGTLKTQGAIRTNMIGQ